jgi:hypothetical protein
VAGVLTNKGDDALFNTANNFEIRHPNVAAGYLQQGNLV